MASLANKVIAISGGASGLGLAIARLVSSRGATVSIADLSESVLETAAHEIKSFSSSSNNARNSKVLTHVVDVRDPAQVDDWISATVAAFGQLDGAANMAGVCGKGFYNEKGSVLSLDNEDWDFVMGVNVTGTMYSQRAELNNMKDGGSIVNASSVAGLRGGAMAAAYSTSKHAVIGLTKSAAKEMGPRGIRVNAVAPYVLFLFPSRIRFVGGPHVFETY